MLAPSAAVGAVVDWAVVPKRDGCVVVAGAAEVPKREGLVKELPANGWAVWAWAVAAGAVVFKPPSSEGRAGWFVAVDAPKGVEEAAKSPPVGCDLCVPDPSSVDPPSDDAAEPPNNPPVCCVCC